jgi:hypothetical protein
MSSSAPRAACRKLRATQRVRAFTGATFPMVQN